MTTNRLQDATSPYLRQHADNPVDWYPWGEEALEKARFENRPILLSIGYSACHWCHVMAHESFEDPATARLMNELFINIKVDREERPDLDKIYQSAHQLLAQRPGGWPLTVFLSPDDQAPFFAGTYFPREARHGLPPFTEVLQSIANAYREQSGQISEQNRSLIRAMEQVGQTRIDRDSLLGSLPLETARQQLGGAFDETHGGFSQAPKFPHPTSINRLLRHWAQTAIGGNRDVRSLYMADFTLTRMALGGIHDQLGGGFYRYSVDGQWMIPHFEKMLYDNGPLLCLYSDLFQATGNPMFRESAIGIADWCLREMQSPEGGFYSTLDADSEGGEGLYYLWQPDEVRSLLTEEEYDHFSRYYGLDREANFEGRWHLHNFESVAAINKALDSSGDEARRLIDSARGKLFKIRQQRQRPGCDTKILTSWNALMIKGLARAGRLLGLPELTAAAEQACDFIFSNLWQDGRLLASHKDGTSAFSAYLDDYAFLLDALLELMQTRWQPQHLQRAVELADCLLAHFRDRENGGFYFTADDHERLIHRPKPLSDESTPAGNGVAAFALGRLGRLLGNSDCLEAAEETLRCAWEQMGQYPQAYCALLEALEEQIRPTEVIIIRGEGEGMEEWQRRANHHYAPQRMTLAIPASETDLPGALQEKRPGDGIIAYICSDTHCEAPVSELPLFDQRLRESEVEPVSEQAQSFSGSVGSFRRYRE
jgi:uncharacterized protein YyaL (SSP411 family)